MFATILSLLLSGAVPATDPGRRTVSPAELERAHSLLAGSCKWSRSWTMAETIGEALGQGEAG